jgi:hypothetical protein
MFVISGVRGCGGKNCLCSTKIAFVGISNIFFSGSRTRRIVWLVIVEFNNIERKMLVLESMDEWSNATPRQCRTRKVNKEISLAKVAKMTKNFSQGW